MEFLMWISLSITVVCIIGILYATYHDVKAGGFRKLEWADWFAAILMLVLCFVPILNVVIAFMTHTELKKYK
jgi:uncharacterized membrane protein YhdT